MKQKSKKMTDALSYCPATKAEIFVTLGLMITMFLIGFGLTGVSLQSLCTYERIKIHYVFKIIFTINAIIYWITYVISVYVYFNCYQIIIAKNKSLNDDPTSPFIMAMAILAGLHLFQYVVLQLNSISMLYITFQHSAFKIGRMYMIILIILVVITALMFMASTFTFQLAFMGNSNTMLLILPFSIATITTILSNIMVLIMFIRRLFLMIRNQSILKSIVVQQQQQPMPRSLKQAQLSYLTALTSMSNKNELLYTQFSNEDSFQPIQQKTNQDRKMLRNINLSRKKASIIKTVSKLITITIVGYAASLIQIGIVFAEAIGPHNDLSKLIAGYVFKIWSMLTILYLCLHFSFSDDFYYGVLCCCVKCDQKIQGILLEKALKSIPNYHLSEPLLEPL